MIIYKNKNTDIEKKFKSIFGTSFNDDEIILQNDDIIIDVDCDEIIYERSYPKLISELKRKQIPLSIKLNQFFFKHNYLWTDCNFSSPAIYFYKNVKRLFNL